MTSVAHTFTGVVPFLTDTFPPDLEGVVADYLGREEVSRFAEGVLACSNRLVQLVEQYKIQDAEDAACVQQGYDIQMVTLFRSNGLSLWRLPVYNVPAKSERDYPVLEDLPAREDGTRSPLCRYKGEGTHVGFIIHVKTRDAADKYWDHIKEKQTVIAISSPYPKQAGWEMVWVNYGQWSGAMNGAYREHHLQNGHKGSKFHECEGCHYFNIQTAQEKTYFLRGYIEDTDPLFQLAGPILQDPPLPLPAPVEPDHQDQEREAVAESAQPVSWLTWLGSCISSLWERFIRLFC